VATARSRFAARVGLFHLERYVLSKSVVVDFEGDGGVYTAQRILGLAMVCL
jgi:hypothetical protein